MNEFTRHASVGKTRRRARAEQPGGLPQLYGTRRRRIPDLFLADRAEARRGGRFRWFFSTCLAAGVGSAAIGAVILGSLDATVMDIPQIPRSRSLPQPFMTQQDGLKWATPKSDRLQTSSGAMSTKYVVQDSLSQQRADRNYIEKRFFARIAIRLAAVPATHNGEIPPFNPFKLYSGSKSGEADAGERDGAHAEGGFTTVRHVELVGSILPPEDGQEIDGQEIAEIVQRSSGAGLNSSEGLIRPSFVPEGTELAMPKAGKRAPTMPEPLAPNTTVLEKSITEPDEIADEVEGQQVKVKLSKGESITKLLQSMGADAWQAREMIDKAKSIFPESAIQAGFEVELTMVPSLTNASKLEPMRFAIFDTAHEHKVTVGRNGAGDFVASASPLTAAPAAAAESDQPASSSLYASLYHAALAQGLSPETILQILRVHAYETDFRRRARGSDSADLFFDLKEEGKAADNPPAELLSTAITVGGDTQRYFRFRTPDGDVDYYDVHGNNSRKFLMRKPVRNEEARFVSGYGMRRHPLLNQVRMHTGIDYSAPMGTPIIAAGNGIVEEQGHKGQNGNYTRIRHANGYQTAYSHMTGRWPPDVKPGSKVRQGQIIGYLGNTGLSTGPHLHFEILVSNRFVDPMSIQMPKERKLTGKQLADFQRERARIEDLMRRPPVRVAQLDPR